MPPLTLHQTAINHELQVMLGSPSQRKILVRHAQLSTAPTCRSLSLPHSHLPLMPRAWQQLGS